MQPRTLDQILQELNTTGGYASQIENIKAKQALVPENIQSNISAAEAAQTKAYEDIITGARRRGVGFSGIPLGEQAKYSSTVFAPAILAAKEQGRVQQLSLEDAMNQLISDRYSKALGIQQYEQQFAENQRQFNEQMAAQRRAAAAAERYNATLANAFTQAQTSNNTKQARYEWSPERGYQFYDAYGNPISAKQYHQNTLAVTGGPSFRDWLTQLNAAHSDNNMQTALKYVGNDYIVGATPESVRSPLAQLGITEGHFYKEAATTKMPIMQNPRFYGIRNIQNA